MPDTPIPKLPKIQIRHFEDGTTYGYIDISGMETPDDNEDAVWVTNDVLVIEVTPADALVLAQALTLSATALQQHRIVHLPLDDDD